MVKSKVISLNQIRLNEKNPRIESFKYSSQEDIIDQLIKNEDVKSLAIEILNNGYISLGERLIVIKNNVDSKEPYTVLEGNRRVAALKMISSEKYRYKFNKEEKEKIEKFNKKNFELECDVITRKEVNDADFKIIVKHIKGIKQWSPIEKRVYYENLFSKIYNKSVSKQKKPDKKAVSKKALQEIAKQSPETEAIISGAIKQERFVKKIYQVTKKRTKKGKLENISTLNSDVLISRVLPRLKEDINLKFDESYKIISQPGEEEILNHIFLILGEATWVNKKRINTRNLNKKAMWADALDKDELMPGLKKYIHKYNDAKKSELGNTAAKQENLSQKANSKSKPTTDSKINQNSEKYKLVVHDKKLFVNKKEFDLKNNIILLNSSSHKIPNEDSEYSKVEFSSENKNFIISNQSIIAKETNNGSYKVDVNYNDSYETFNINLSVNKEENTNLFTDEWLADNKKLLEQSSINCEKIIAALEDLNDIKDLAKKGNGKETREYIVIAFLIRLIVEYSTKAYIDKFGIKPENPSLSNLIHLVIQQLFVQKRINKERKKLYAKVDDLDTLNSMIHDYRTTLSAINVKSTFNKYELYLEDLFNALGDQN